LACLLSATAIATLPIQVLDRENRAFGLSKEYQEGILFLTYSALISHAKGSARLDQVVQWLGGPGFEARADMQLADLVPEQQFFWSAHLRLHSHV
jgi:hypothetical protein